MDKCRLTDCDKPIKRKGYCYSHYMKQWRYGTPYPEWPDRYEPLIGKRYGTLVVSERKGNFWLCVCDCGNTRLTRTGDLNRTGDANTCGNKANHLAEFVDYSGAHGRVHSKYGAASNYQCVTCDRPAYHWSYNHDDPNEMISESGLTAGIAYSMDPQHYSPRCVPCHKRFDLDNINATLFERVAVG